jgi:death-on-curing protein
MEDPRWLRRTVVDAIHDDQLQQHGGLFGVRDEGAIESALARPKHLWTYGEETDLDAARLAAAYGVGIARNYGYRDGNKRTAFMAVYVFLKLNGYRIEADQPAIVDLVRAVADGECSEEEMSEWLRAYTVPSETSS